MEKRINITKLLNNAPFRLKLWSPEYGMVSLYEIRKGYVFSIKVYAENRHEPILYDSYGGLIAGGECRLFPSKDCLTWKYYKPPKEQLSFPQIVSRSIIDAVDRGAL